MGITVDELLPGSGRSVGDVLLDVHRSYRNDLRPSLEAGTVRGMAHITGGGLAGNLPRTLGSELGAVIDLAHLSH